MRDALPTLADVHSIQYKSQRRKNIIPLHATLTAKHNLRIVALFRAIDESDSEIARSQLRDDLKELLEVKKRHEVEVLEKMRNDLESRVLSPPASIRLKKKCVGGREVVVFNKIRPSLMLFDRFVALRLKRAFGINASGRDQSLRVLHNTLLASSRAGTVRQGVIRLDIEKFYESIEHDELQRKLANHAGVPNFVKEHVQQVMHAYRRVTGRSRGLPDGVPSSATLAEIYLERFDFSMRHHPDVALFVRYADDMVVVCEPERTASLDRYVDELLTRDKLVRNATKSTTLKHPDPSTTSFDFLGYKFIFEQGTSRLSAVDLSDAKTARYMEGLRRLKAYADSIPCWADQVAVDRYLALDSYLFHAHATANAGHGIRIVTGLAYSARFMNGPLSKRRNFQGLLKSYRKELGSRWGAKIAKLEQGVPLSCACCGQLIHRAEAIATMSSDWAGEREIMHTKGAAHLDDEIHDWAKELLWD